MGVVYEAVRESLRSHVALKVMHPQSRHRENQLRRFRTEAEAVLAGAELPADVFAEPK
jgi:hypothetical protein